MWLNANDMTNHDPEDTAQQRTYRAFEALIDGEDSAIDLLQAALLIASIEYPDLDAPACLGKIDELARRVRTALALSDPVSQPQLPADLDHVKVIEALNQVLFREEHFHGNRRDYFNPHNSFFHKVVEMHTGIPITLSLLYLEVGRRVGLEIEGVALPFQFVVRLRLPADLLVYVDPYEQGLILSEDACKQRILRMSRGRIKINQRWFTPVSKRLFLARMLNNLKHIYLDTEDYERLLPICDFILLLVPHYAHEWRDRGMVHLQLKHYSRARRDLESYLELAPQADDYHEIREYLRTIRQLIARMN
ncbi:MAG TPA: transglutaminase-like domain-containing protein [Ktedonobacteraceae bacterium]|nr:transglutaminase-like domain-containing protein [Ktedonobacteraceae bacterium]